MDKEYFLERDFVIDKAELFFEAEDMLKFSKPIDDFSFRSPQGSTLYVDLSKVDYIDYPFVLFAFVTQQRSKFPRKHLVFFEPKDYVLNGLGKIGRKHKTRFICLKNGTLNVVGTPMIVYEEAVFKELLESNQWLSIRELMKSKKIQRSFARNHQVLASFVNDGIVRIKKAKGEKGTGRPLSQFLPFWPRKAELWDVGGHIYPASVMQSNE